MLHYIPVVKRQFIVYLTDTKSTMTRHFDTLSEDYREHVTIVRQKLRELASGFIAACVQQVCVLDTLFAKFYLSQYHRIESMNL